MAISKANFNSFNVTPTASKFITFNSSNNGLAADDVGGNLKLLSTQTASSSASLSFTSDIDSTYKEYIFKFINLHPATNNAYLTFQASIDGGSNYNVATTSTIFSAYHDEADSATSLGYNTSRDAAQSTSFIPLQVDGVSNNADGSSVGIFHLFDPSNTTFVKQFFYTDQNMAQTSAYSSNAFTGGKINTTSAVNAIQFKFHSGNIDSGVIKMYGVT